MHRPAALDLTTGNLYLSDTGHHEARRGGAPYQIEAPASTRILAASVSIGGTPTRWGARAGPALNENKSMTGNSLKR